MPRSFPEPRPAAVPICAVAFDDAAYPARLHDLSDAPAVIYTRGTFAIANPPAVAIVGTRNATPYGLRVARAVATVCAQAGVCVVSGLARGIDGAAHEAALAAGGRTVAVLGTGPDVYYPPRHRGLQEAIARDGLLLSEFPAGSTGHRGAFPQRNRLIAALADLTVIVEAPEHSGALHTADAALRLNRKVAIVPGAIDIPSAAGSNALLQVTEVVALLSPREVVGLIGLDARPPHRPACDSDAALVWDAIQRGADSLASLSECTGLPPAGVQAALGLLEIDGLVAFDAAGRVRSSLA